MCVRCLSCHPHRLTPVQVKAARRAAIKPEKLQRATDTIQDAFASAQRMSIWEGLLLGNSDWNMYVTRIFIL